MYGGPVCLETEMGYPSVEDLMIARRALAEMSIARIKSLKM